MKKILGLTIAALLVMGLVGGGTWAYFSDPESSTGNILTAGTLDLTINSANDPVTILSIANAYPGASGGNSTTLANAGSLNGTLDIAITGVGNIESSPGLEYTGDSLNGTVGELGAFAQIAMYLDLGGATTYDGSDIGLGPDGNTYTGGSLIYATVDNYTGDSWTDVYGGNLEPGASDDFYILWDFPLGASVNNTPQGDAVSVNMTFTLE
ncbi:TasA family protein [Chloroflexota bacterium]